MARWDVLVEVSPRSEVADPAGATTERALAALGFDDVCDVRIGKSIRFCVAAPTHEAAQALVTEMCDRLLANPVIEDARISVAAQQLSRSVAQ